jgi:hypothetical protein
MDDLRGELSADFLRHLCFPDGRPVVTMGDLINLIAIGEESKQRREDWQAQFEAGTARILDQPLPNGMRLGDARKGDVEAAEQFVKQQAILSAQMALAVKAASQGQLTTLVQSILAAVDLMTQGPYHTADVAALARMRLGDLDRVESAPECRRLWRAVLALGRELPPPYPPGSAEQHDRPW